MGLCEASTLLKKKKNAIFMVQYRQLWLPKFYHKIINYDRTVFVHSRYKNVLKLLILR